MDGWMDVLRLTADILIPIGVALGGVAAAGISRMRISMHDLRDTLHAMNLSHEVRYAETANDLKHLHTCIEDTKSKVTKNHEGMSEWKERQAERLAKIETNVTTLVEMERAKGK